MSSSTSDTRSADARLAWSMAVSTILMAIESSCIAGKISLDILIFNFIHHFFGEYAAKCLLQIGSESGLIQDLHPFSLGTNNTILVQFSNGTSNGGASHPEKLGKL